MVQPPSCLCIPINSILVCGDVIAFFSPAQKIEASDLQRYNCNNQQTSTGTNKHLTSKLIPKPLPVGPLHCLPMLLLPFAKPNSDSLAREQHAWAMYAGADNQA
jgi:hypothetical protein